MQLKRYEGSFRSPVVQTIQASMNGLASIRAYGAEHQMINEFDQVSLGSASFVFVFGILILASRSSFWCLDDVS